VRPKMEQNAGETGESKEEKVGEVGICESGERREEMIEEEKEEEEVPSLENAHELSLKGDEAFARGKFEASAKFHAKAAELFKTSAKGMIRVDPRTSKALKLLAKNERRKSKAALSATNECEKKENGDEAEKVEEKRQGSECEQTKQSERRDVDTGDGNKTPLLCERLSGNREEGTTVSSAAEPLVPRAKQHVWEAYQNLRIIERRLLGGSKKASRAPSPTRTYGNQSVLGESFLVVPPSRQHRKFHVNSVTAGEASGSSAVHIRNTSKVASRSKMLGSKIPTSASIRVMEKQLHDQECEILRLLQTIDRLSSENTQLLRDTQEVGRLRRENNSLRLEMREFRASYREHFTQLKHAMEEMTRRDKEKRNRTSNERTTAAQKPVVEASAARKDDRVCEDSADGEFFAVPRPVVVSTSAALKDRLRHGYVRSETSLKTESSLAGPPAQQRDRTSRYSAHRNDGVAIARHPQHTHGRPQRSRRLQRRETKTDRSKARRVRTVERSNRRRNPNRGHETSVGTKSRNRNMHRPVATPRDSGGKGDVSRSDLMSSAQSALEFPFARSITEF